MQTRVEGLSQEPEQAGSTGLAKGHLQPPGAAATYWHPGVRREQGRLKRKAQK